MRTKRVLFLATSKKTRGGITAVLKAYEQYPFWKDYQVCWIETHIDRGMFPGSLSLQNCNREASRELTLNTTCPCFYPRDTFFVQANRIFALSYSAYIA